MAQQLESWLLLQRTWVRFTSFWPQKALGIHVLCIHAGVLPKLSYTENVYKFTRVCACVCVRVHAAEDTHMWPHAC